MTLRTTTMTPTKAASKVTWDQAISRSMAPATASMLSLSAGNCSKGPSASGMAARQKVSAWAASSKTSGNTQECPVALPARPDRQTTPARLATSRKMPASSVRLPADCRP
ncbi:hypothetical protein D9M72_341160 [compost metagenome]